MKNKMTYAEAMLAVNVVGLAELFGHDLQSRSYQTRAIAIGVSLRDKAVGYIWDWDMEISQFNSMSAEERHLAMTSDPR